MKYYLKQPIGITCLIECSVFNMSGKKWHSYLFYLAEKHFNSPLSFSTSSYMYPIANPLNKSTLVTCYSLFPGSVCLCVVLSLAYKQRAGN